MARNEGQHFFNHVNEKLRILGEIPLRKFDAQGNPMLDPDGNPDTSFLAKIPADTPFTFQTLDSNGMVLNMAQTWHQVRPGEMRADCGGCHAHSQQPLDFDQTAAGKAGLCDLVDLTQANKPLLTQDDAGQAELPRHSPDSHRSGQCRVLPRHAPHLASAVAPVATPRPTPTRRAIWCLDDARAVRRALHYQMHSRRLLRGCAPTTRRDVGLPAAGERGR